MTQNTLSVEGLQATIGYLYLLSFCPPEHVLAFQQASAPLRQGLARQAQISEPEYFSRVLPEACRRIVAFHQGTREPDAVAVNTLVEAVFNTLNDPLSVGIFQAEMAGLAALPARAKPGKRLRSTRGCQFCRAACRYGYFCLVTEPNFDLLGKFLEAETKKPSGEQDPLQAAWTFANAHLWRALGTEQGYISADHLGNLAYCLQVLSASASRYPLPEEQYQGFQDANQSLIQNYPVPEPA